MKDTNTKKLSFDDRLFDLNMKAAIAFGLAIIAFLLIYIAFYK